MARRPVQWQEIREQCAEVLWREVSAPKLPNVCRRLGLDTEKTDMHPMSSKRAYVHSLIDPMANEDVITVAQRIVDEYSDFKLRELVDKAQEANQIGVSEISRRKLLELLDGYELSGSIDLLEFLNDMWPLDQMDEQGQDRGSPRGGEKSLLEEIHRHCIRFPDWSNSQLLSLLGLLHSSNALLFRFLAMCVHPRTRSEVEQRQLAEQITEILRRDGFALAQVGVESGYPIFDVVPVAALGVSPASEDVSITLASFDEEGVHAAWKKSIARKNSDPEGAITSARTLLETVCKHVLNQQQIPYQPNDDLPKLWKLCAESLNLAPSQHTLEPFKQVLGGCTSIVQGLGTVRNRIGDAHGQGRRPVKPKPRHAALAVDLAGTMATFIVATFHDRASRMD